MSLLTGLFPIGTDSEGRTLPKCWLYSYTVGTNTPKDTYSDAGLTTPNANPLESDGSGWFPDVYLGAGGYKLVLRDAAGVVIKEQDNYYPSATSADIAALEADIAALSSDAALIGGVYTDSGAADAYVLTIQGTLDPPTAYASPMQIIFIPTNANTGASTVNVESLGLKALQDQSGNALSAGFLETGKYFCFIYQSGAFRYMWRSGLVSVKALATDAVETVKIKDKNVTTAKMADGTALKLLGYNSSGVVTEYTNNNLVIGNGSIASAASVSFALSTLDTAQAVGNGYLIRLVGFQPASDDVNLYMRFSSDGGSTWVATNYEAITSGSDTTGTARSVFSALATQATVAGSGDAGKSLSNAANETATLQMYLFRVNTGTSYRPHIIWQLDYYNADGALTTQTGSASNTAAADYDAVQFIWEGGGNFAAIGYYGIQKISGG